MAISNEAVEVTARALAADGDPMGEWDRQEETYKSWYRNRAKRILEAAAPIIRAEALNEVAAHLDQPRILWWGDEGAKVADSPDNPRKFTRLTAWLCARAVAERGGR